MTSSEIKEILKNYTSLQMQAALSVRNESKISDDVKAKVQKFGFVKQCLEMLPPDEKNIVTAVYVNRNSIARIARERNFSRTTIYYHLKKAVKRLAESIPLA